MQTKARSSQSLFGQIEHAVKYDDLLKFAFLGLSLVVALIAVLRVFSVASTGLPR
jgi:hypothetical protein